MTSDKGRKISQERNSSKDVDELAFRDTSLDGRNPFMAFGIFHRAERLAKCEIADDVKSEPIEPLPR